MVAGAGLGWGWAVGWAGAGDDSVRYNFPIVMSADQRGPGWAGAGLGEAGQFLLHFAAQRIIDHFIQ